MKTNRRKAQFPVAKYREDGTPAIWLTFDLWSMLRSSFADEYRTACARMGEDQAMRDSEAMFALIDCFGAACNKTQKENALALYRIGFDAFEAGRKTDYPAKSIEKLEQEGKDAFDRAYAAKFEELSGWRTTKMIRARWPYDVTSLAPLSAWSGPNSKPNIQGKVDFDALVNNYGRPWVQTN